jgi:hypothetical protein
LLEFINRYARLATGFFGDLSQNLFIRLKLFLVADVGGGPQKLDNMLSSESDPYRRI